MHWLTWFKKFHRRQFFGLFWGVTLFISGCAALKPDLTNPNHASAWEIIAAYPHDRGAFTEGLVITEGKLYESTGLNGASTVREVDLASGNVLQSRRLASEYFGEGLTELHGKLYQLTWQEQTAFVYDRATLTLEKEFHYAGEGWGLTTDGTDLIMSDGTSRIKFLDAGTFKTKRTIEARLNGRAVRELNELEYINGEIWANVWHSAVIVRINPQTGEVAKTVDLTGLLQGPDRLPDTGVLNGIAYNRANGHFYVTGKNWPKLFEVRLKP